MIIETLVLGELQTNCYLLTLKNDCILIDPAADANKIKKNIDDKNLLATIITHYHFDHVGALEDFKENIIDFHSEEGKHEIGPFKFEIIKTPGHKSDCISIYFKDEGKMFVGDFIFKGSIGRTDLPTGDPKAMLTSLKKLIKYDNMLLYPGHGKSTSLDEEKACNPYFQGLE